MLGPRVEQHGLCESMILDIARLLLFPALMAFAAASDLFTMTISNRVSLALVAGFLALALLGGMGLHDMLPASRRRCRRPGGRPLPVSRWAGSAAATPRWRPASRSGSVSTISSNYLRLCVAVRRRADAVAAPVPAMAAALPAHRPGLAAPAARQAERNPLRHRARDRRADGLSGDRMDQGGRPHPPRDALTGDTGNALVKAIYTRLINHALTNSWSTPITAAEASRRNVESEAYEYRSHCRPDHRPRRWRHCRISRQRVRRNSRAGAGCAASRR